MASRLSRRDVIAGATASAIALSAPTLAARTTVARGFVFEDRNGDGRRRPGASGIAGVMVSNGRDVAVTADDGGWSLPVKSGDSIFVIKPPDWATPTSPGGIPSFSYIHQPDGSPAYLGRGVELIAPTGPLPASLNFPLIRRPESRTFEAVLMSDTQPENAAELDYVRDDIIAAMLSINAAFGVNHGDVVADDLSLYKRYLQILGSTGIPWHHCPGNHDLNHAAHDDRFSRETWKKIFGARHYAFQHGNATFFVLDNVDYLGRASRRYRGVFGQRQLDFVRNVLRHVPRDHLIVCCMHIPLQCYLDAENPADTTADYRELLQLLADRPHTVSFAGHLHTTEHHYLNDEPGLAGRHTHHHHVLTAASGSWWSGPSDHRGIPTADSADGTPNGFHILSVQNNQYSTRFVPAIAKPSSQLRVLLDGRHRRRIPGTPAQSGTVALGLCVPEIELGACRIVANVFDGGPKTRVSFEIMGCTRAEPMQKVSMPDPIMLDIFAGSAPRKSWVQAVSSSHMWQAPLPTTLSPGAYVLLVRAVDEYNREHMTRSIIEVQPSASL